MLTRFVILLLTSLVYSVTAHAAGDLSRQEPLTVTVELGTEDGKMQFTPSDLNFETGKLYRMVLVNNSPHKHYFSSDKFVQSIFTRKVQTYTPDGEETAEIKGHIREVEVFPGHTAEWWFVPIQTGKFDDLICTVDGHAEAGMTGTITIE
ncbi:MAG: plastocyanin/azurin family copper-binding protein [Gammaproteobacteria bacterium]|nr:plastocyanin/azurin family copper-binding protein [Gammaproteobacteria bacterium]